MPEKQYPVLNRALAVRAKCIDCSCYELAEVTACELRGCPLWPWRSGRKPKGVKLSSDISEYFRAVRDEVDVPPHLCRSKKRGGGKK